ncbi:hypothetical protein BN1180_04295 [Peribacillus simplex]|uniref:Uncharacterized protein n=1 Tax=Peribacillus simplex TaxID=1478 RepID=A0AAN2PL17_9BACI|nr:hypothetical protein BN1180_04295 [Peribacillus simplex]
MPAGSKAKGILVREKKKMLGEISAQAFFFMSLLNKTVLWHRRNARVMKGISSNLFQKQYNWKGRQDCYRDWHGGNSVGIVYRRNYPGK